MKLPLLDHCRNAVRAGDVVVVTYADGRRLITPNEAWDAAHRPGEVQR